LVRFRSALMRHGLDRRLIERTLELAERDGGFSPRAPRAALDSSPLWGAGRVEETYNLLGHALRKALSVIARQQGWGLAAVAADAGAELVAGSGLKAALDSDWDNPDERQRALGLVLGSLEAVEQWVALQPERGRVPRVAGGLAVAPQVRAQDLAVAPDGTARLCQGVARERRIAIEDADMRHGRKSRRQRVDGYKRHVLRDLDTGLLRAVGVTPANAAEASVPEAIVADLQAQPVQLAELHIDRG
jgi:hypothetical protein